MRVKRKNSKIYQKSCITNQTGNCHKPPSHKNSIHKIAVMAAIEAKGYLEAYREILCFLIAGVLIGAVLYAGAKEMAARGSLFEPFTVGVVDRDGTPELIFVFDFFNEYVIDLEFMEKEDALDRLSSGDIPAFIELPENFTRDVFHGQNSPFIVHLNRGFPLQGSLVQLLATGGIAYLSASQAGVYATLEYAFGAGGAGYAGDAGMSWEEVQSILMIPVNMAFASELIHHDRLFVREFVPLVAGDPADHFLRRFVVFWYMLSLLALLKFLPWYTPGVVARFKLAGVPVGMMFGIKWAGLYAATTFLAIPIMFVVGIANALLLSIFVSFFGLLSGKLFDRHEKARGLFIFFVALIMYFASGGIVPYVFLPQWIMPMRYLSIVYWMGL